MVSHSINSDSASYDDLPITDVFVTIVDNDKPGLDIRQFEDIDGNLVADNTTEVLEGTDGLTDVYQFALTTPPAGDETVTVTLSHDSQISLSQSVFTFDASDWDTFRTVIVTADDDINQDGTEISTITHEITTSGSASPVFDVLSKRVERVLAGRAAGDREAASVAGVAREALGSLSNEAQRLGLFGAIWLAITGVGLLIPFGAALVPVALAALAIVFLPLEYAGFALDRRRVSFAARRAWLASQRPKALGFGAAGLAIGLVPGLNFLLLPVLIVAGTVLVLESPPDG